MGIEAHRVGNAFAMSVEKALRTSSLFQGVSEEGLELLIPVCHEEVGVKGAVIVKQGEYARCLYLVDDGRVGLHMTLERPDGSTTGETTVASIGPGEPFGWSALVQPYLSTLSATVVEQCRLIALEGSALRALLNEHCEIGYAVMVNVASLIAERLAETREALVYHRSYVEYLQRLEDRG